MQIFQVKARDWKQSAYLMHKVNQKKWFLLYEYLKMQMSKN